MNFSQSRSPTFDKCQSIKLKCSDNGAGIPIGHPTFKARQSSRHSYFTYYVQKISYHLVTLTILLFLSSSLLAEDWPHWRGASRDDKSNEPSGWNGKSWDLKKQNWSFSAGLGASSPVVVKNKLYVIGWKNGKNSLYCLDAKSGKTLWDSSFPCPQYGRHSKGDKRIYSGATATPEYDSKTGFLLTLSQDGDLYCFDTRKKGRVVWKLNLYQKYKISQRPNVGKRKSMLRDYGYTTSPFVYKNQVIVEAGDARGTLMAFDIQTGKELWHSDHKDPAGHTGSPVFMTIEKIPCLAVLTSKQLLVIRLDKKNQGKTVATFPWQTDYANNIATPTVQGNEILITSAYNQYAMAKIRITLAGAKQVWKNENPSGVCSPIIHRGKIYWAWRGVHCVDWKTGKEDWTGGKVGTAGSCLITKDDRLVVFADRGTLTLVETTKRSPKKYTELKKVSKIFRTDVWSHVILANRILYCKDRNGNLKSFKLP